MSITFNRSFSEAFFIINCVRVFQRNHGKTLSQHIKLLKNTGSFIKSREGGVLCYLYIHVTITKKGFVHFRCLFP